MAYMEFPENVTYNDLWSDVIKVNDYYHSIGIGWRYYLNDKEFN